MTMKKSVIGLSAGIAVGVAVGIAAGMIVKAMTCSKSGMKKKISGALGSVGNFFDSLSKITG